jgi:hypothetical protein
VFGKYVIAASALVGVLALSAGGSANASVISTGPLAAISGVTSQLTDWTGNIVLPKFNSSLGLLQSVSISVSDSITTTLTVTNSAATASNGQVNTQVAVGINDPLNLFTTLGTGVNLVNGGGFATSSLFRTSTNPEAYTLAAGAHSTLAPTTITGSGLASFSQGSILAEFTGSGNLSLSASTLTNTQITNVGGNSSAAQITNASATGTVSYTYIPASQLPEPFSAALLGSAVVGLGLLRRRFI